MNYNLLLFDADGTLFDYDRAEKYALAEAFLQFRIDWQENFLHEYRMINDSMWKEFEKGLVTIKEVKLKRFTNLFEKLSLRLDADDFSKKYLEFLSRAGFLIHGSLEIINSFINRCEIAIITNGIKKVQESRFANSPLVKIIQNLFISDAIGIAKPDKKIFSFVLNQLKHESLNDVLMIGDSLTSDIQGGINASIDTCWYNPEKKLNNKNIVPTYEIQNLNELKKIIK